MNDPNPYTIDHQGRALPKTSLRANEIELGCTLLECSAEKAAIAVPGVSPAERVVGVSDCVQLVFDLPGIEVPLVLSADVMASNEEDDHARYELRFGTDSEASQDVPVEARWLFNRRQAIRVRLDGEHVEAALKIGAGELVSGCLIDVSSTGICVSVPSAWASTAEGSVEANFNLPRQCTSLTLMCWIVSKRQKGDQTWIGLAFDAQASEFFDEQEMIIVDYIARCLLAEAA